MTERRGVVAIAGFLVLSALPLWLTPLGAQEPVDRVKQIGGKLMCGVGTPMCTCKQILTQCNHVGCSNSAMMMKNLENSVAKGDSEEAIIQGFIQDYGGEVLAEPPKSGFTLIAWLLPSFYLLGGAALVVFVIWRWRKHPALETAGGQPRAREVSPELLERARALAARETED